jgi:hypothetical protein
MNNNRPSLDQIYGLGQGAAQQNAAVPGATQDPTNPTGNRPSLSDIYSGNQFKGQAAQPVQNNRETIFRSSNGNYLDNITPDGPIQSTVNFVGDLAGSAYTPFQKLGNTLLSGVNAGMEKLTGMPTPENMKFDLGTDASMNPITGESSLPVYKDEKGNVMGAGGTTLNTLGTLAEAGLNAVVPGEGTALKTALLADGLLPTLLKGFKSGTKLGLGFGAATGAQGITDASDGSQWGQAALTTGLGGLIGGPLGLIGGLLSNAANSRLRKTFMEDIQKGLSMEESPAIKEVANVLGMNTPEAVARTRQDSIDQIYKEITQSTRNPIQNIDAQMTTDPAYKDDVLGTLIDNISVGDTFGKNRVNWSGTTKALTEKEELLNQALKDVQDADSNGMRVSTGLTPDSLLNYIQTAASSVTRDKDVVNDVVAKASSKIAQYTKNGSITLDGLNALRDIGNDLYRAGDPTGSAMSLAIKRYTQDVLANPQSFGLSEKVVNAINDNDLIWNELRKIKLTKTFLKKWAPETLLKDTGFARQLAGAVGFGVSNGNFFGYLGAQALTDKILNSAAKSKMMKLYGNAFTKMGADKASGDLRKGLMDNIAAIGKEEMEKRQAAQKKSIIKDLAKMKEKEVADAKYSPPNQNLYEPYTPESQLPTIQMGRTSKKSTEPYIDINTGKLVDPKVLGTAGLALAAAGGQQASAMQKGTPAQAPRHADNPLKLTPEQIENIKQTIAGKETGGEKDPYTATNTKQSAHGVDRGRFQFSDSLRKELTELYFGKVISPEEFTPAVQEELMTRHIQSLLDNGFSVGQIFRIHRKGLQGMMSETAMDYGEKALKKYNSLEKERASNQDKAKKDSINKGATLYITPELKKILNMK